MNSLIRNFFFRFIRNNARMLDICKRIEFIILIRLPYLFPQFWFSSFIHFIVFFFFLPFLYHVKAGNVCPLKSFLFLHLFRSFEALIYLWIKIFHLLVHYQKISSCYTCWLLKGPITIHNGSPKFSKWNVDIRRNE